MRKRLQAVILAVAASVAGCSAYFVAAYNPAVDSGAAALQQKVDGFLTDLHETTGTPAGEYERHSAFYDGVRADIDSLRQAAAAQPGNSLTLESLDLIENNVDKLEVMHADGISPTEIEIVRTLFDAQFRLLRQLENAKKRKES